MTVAGKPLSVNEPALAGLTLIPDSDVERLLPESETVIDGYWYGLAKRSLQFH